MLGLQYIIVVALKMCVCVFIALKNIGGMTSRAGLGSGDSDFDESVEEVKRRKKHRGGIDLDPALRYGQWVWSCCLCGLFLWPV